MSFLERIDTATLPLQDLTQLPSFFHLALLISPIFWLVLLAIKWRHWKRLSVLCCLFYLGVAGEVLLLRNSIVLGAICLAAMGLGVILWWMWDRDTSWDDITSYEVPPAFEWPLFALLSLALAGMKLYRWKEQAVGILVDEAHLGTRALNLLDKGLWPYKPIWDMRGSLASYLEALSILTVGTSEWAIRVVPIMAAVSLGLLSYFIFRHLLGKGVALVAYACLAFGLWSNIESRQLQLEVTVPVCLSLTMLFWLRAWHKGHYIDFAAAGFFFVFGFTSWVPYRVIPLLLGLSFLHTIIFQRTMLSQRWKGIALFLIIVIAASGWIIFPHLDFFFPKSDHVKQILAYENPAKRFLCNVGMFIDTFNHTMHPTTDIFRREGPILNAFLSIFFIAGLSWTLVNTRRHGAFFVMAWGVVFAIPGLMSEPNPRRIIGLISWVYLLVGVGVFLFIWLLGGLFKRRKFVMLLSGMLLLTPAFIHNFPIIHAPYREIRLGQSETSTILGKYLATHFHETQIYCFVNFDELTVNYFTYLETQEPFHFRNHRMREIFPLFDKVEKDALCIIGFGDYQDSVLEQLHHLLPGGSLETIKFRHYEAFRTYRVPRAQRIRLRGLGASEVVHQRQETKSALVLPPNVNDIQASLIVAKEGEYKFESLKDAPFQCFIDGIPFSENRIDNGRVVALFLKRGLHDFRLHLDAPIHNFRMNWQKPGQESWEPMLPCDFYTVANVHGPLRAERVMPAPFALKKTKQYQLSADGIGEKRHFYDFDIDTGGNIWALETIHFKHLRYDQKAVLMASTDIDFIKTPTLPKGWAVQSAIVCAPWGGSLVVDFWNCRVWEVGKNGDQHNVVYQERFHPLKIALSSDQQLYLIEREKLFHCDLSDYKEGEVYPVEEVTWLKLKEPITIGFNNSGCLVLLDRFFNSLFHIDLEKLSFFQTPFMAYLDSDYDICFDEVDNIYLLQRVPNKLYILNSNGDLLLKRGEARWEDVFKPEQNSQMWAIDWREGLHVLKTNGAVEQWTTYYKPTQPESNP